LSNSAFRQGIYQSEFARKIARWLEAMPHPPLGLEISQDHIAGARWTRTGSLDDFAAEPLPPGALTPSAVESNITNPMAVKSAIASVMSRLRAKDEDVAMLVPDPDYPEPWRWAYDVEAAVLADAGAEVEPIAWTADRDVSAFDLILPLVVWGSGLLARLMARHEWIVWVGGAVLGYVAGEMMTNDPIKGYR